MLFTDRYVQRLVQLLEIDTVTPMESHQASQIAHANAVFADWAASLGMHVAFAGPGDVCADADYVTPKTVERLCYEHEDFLAWQPHTVLEIGEGPKQRTLMFNFHMDTVSPHLPVLLRDGCVQGRGAVDNKGPGLAILAAIEEVQRTQPQVLRDIRLLIQVVAGEEGGAMGVYGTRYLCNRGHVGALNVFVEPSGDGYFDASTTSMTYEIRMDGNDSTDDFPERGDNASLILSFMAQEMARLLAEPVKALEVKITLAGIHTGLHHNRVYGSGHCLFNFSYGSVDAGRQLAAQVDQAYVVALARCRALFAELHPFSATIERLTSTCSSSWLKRDLPVLNNRDAAMEAILMSAGISRNTCSAEAFTCDAMWAQAEGAYSIVWGPGSLAVNGAHTALEYVRLDDLESFTCAVHRLITQFATATAHTKS
ncbi:M20/M25/M40 family metallo-hydrolase [Pseudomonas sp. B329]|uniref:M20 family metallopeptidase n=1 Tax=Pseudomonas sp. B329 TaxID=1553459 RepID=UPI0020049477|nr:M20/M25/M40 family metallo-hydrolase [Pseudomonas sp. B329]MCK3860977.1 M20/M25/M40 family metallo-hydrolase [Pseudomonas sp. B329]